MVQRTFRSRGHGRNRRIYPAIQPINFKVKLVDGHPCPDDPSVGGMNKFAAEDPRWKIPYPHPEGVLIVDGNLSKEGIEKTIRHEKTEALIMKNTNLGYESAHELTNRIDFVHGNTFSKKSKK